MFGLLYDILRIAGEDGGDLRAGGAALRVKVDRGAFLCALDELRGDGPGEGVVRIGAGLLRIREGREIGARGRVDALERCIAEEDGGDLLAGHIALRVELVAADAVDNTGPCGPCDCVGIVGVDVHIGESRRGLRGRLAVKTPQDRDEHAAGHGLLRSEQVLLHTVEETVLICKADIVIEPVGLRDIAERVDPRLLGLRAVHDGDRGDIGGEALALRGLIGVLLLADTVAEAEAAGDIGGLRNVLGRAGAGVPRDQDGSGNLSRAVFVDIILVDAAVLIGERRGEVRGVGRRDGIARAELDPGVCQQAADGRIEIRSDDLFAAVLPVLVADDLGLGQRLQLGEGVGLCYNGGFALVALIDGQNDRLGGLFAAEAEFRRRTGVDQVDDIAVLGLTGATAAAAAHAVIRQPDLIDRVVVFVLIVGADQVVGRRFRRGVSGRCKGRDQHAGQHGEAQQQNCRTPRGLMEESHVISLLFLKSLSFCENNRIHSSTRSSKCLILCLKN